MLGSGRSGLSLLALLVRLRATGCCIMARCSWMAFASTLPARFRWGFGDGFEEPEGALAEGRLGEELIPSGR